MKVVAPGKNPKLSPLCSLYKATINALMYHAMTSRYATIAQHCNKDLHAHVIHDPLAVDRTILANERTFLAYIRTAMTTLVGGLSLISFFEGKFIPTLGWLTLLPTTYLFLKGAQHYYSLKRTMLSDFIAQAHAETP